MLGQRTADLPCAKDDDLHPVTPLKTIQPRAAAILISLA
jgi:hypothetical protein